MHIWCCFLIKECYVRVVAFQIILAAFVAYKNMNFIFKTLLVQFIFYDTSTREFSFIIAMLELDLVELSKLFA